MSAAADAQGAQLHPVAQQPASVNAPTSAAVSNGGGSSAGGTVRVRKNRFAEIFSDDKPGPAAAAAAPTVTISAALPSTPAVVTGTAAKAGLPAVPRAQNGRSAPRSSSSSSDSSSSSTR